MVILNENYRAFRERIASFLQRAAMLRAVLAIEFLSVRPSDTRQYYVKTNEHRMIMFSLQLRRCI